MIRHNDSKALVVAVVFSLVMALFTGCDSGSGSQEETAGKEDTDSEGTEEDTNAEEVSGSKETGEESSEDSEDDSIVDDVQKKIDELAQDIKDGNVIPDDHE